MGLYNHCLDNTPFMSSLVTQGKALFFKNAYSSFVNTVPSITASFSQGNLQTGLTFPQGDTLISMAKKAGIKTYWISNQVQNGDFDTPIGAISSLVDYTFFTTRYLFDHSYGAQNPDLILLPELERTFNSLDPKANNLVIIHLMGCHSPYDHRYPCDYPETNLNQPAHIGALSAHPQFSEEIIGGSDYEQYLTSIRYNDDVIKAISDLVLERSDFAAMLYYSDHAEALLYQSYNDIVAQNETAPAGRHNVAQFSFAMTRIPLIVALSKRYQRNYPQSAAALAQHQEAIFTNDTLYDLVLDLMQVKSQAINYELALSNPSYQRGTPDQVALLNQKIVGTDPDYLAFQHAQLPDANILAINAANSTFKANSSLAKGYANLTLNTIWCDGELYVCALKEFSKDFYTLPEFLAQVRDRDNQPLLSSKVQVIVQLDNSAELSSSEQAALNSYLKNLAPEIKLRCLFVSANEQLLPSAASDLGP